MEQVSKAAHDCKTRIEVLDKQNVEYSSTKV